MVSFAAMREIVVQRTDSQLADILSRQPSAPYESTDSSGSHGPRGSGGLPGMPVGGIIVESTDSTEAGAILTRTGWMLLDDTVIDHILASSTPRITTIDVTSFGKYRFQATVVNGTTFLVGLPLSDADNIVSTVLWIELALAAIAILGAIIVTRVVVIRNLRPLHEVARVAAEVSRRELDRGEVDLSLRVPESNADPSNEVGRVGLALNTMLTNVESALAARQASETKVRQFVADASHELRTPLTAIRGYTELMRMTEDFTPDGQKSLDRVRSQSERMTTLVEDLLLLARLDEGQPLKLSEVDLTQLVIETVSDEKVIAPDHHWHLELPEEPVTLRGDASQLRQVLVNLLSNARKHTGAGTTVVTGVARSADGSALVTVTDDGGGIPAGFVDHIFSRFARADASRAGTAPASGPAASEGTSGLGLSIVQAIMEAHGGSVEVTSRPGRTEFALRLPATS
ncbi:MAG TPA: sensor histidine kinase [Arthrobacter bacterium]|nr:sensor histidine kinase [Arthrobacter sp.]